MVGSPLAACWSSTLRIVSNSWVMTAEGMLTSCSGVSEALATCLPSLSTWKESTALLVTRLVSTSSKDLAPVTGVPRFRTVEVA
ncbi:hypothetical protein D3C87_1860250 [compost metagenome]